MNEEHATALARASNSCAAVHARTELLAIVDCTCRRRANADSAQLTAAAIGASAGLDALLSRGPMPLPPSYPRAGSLVRIDALVAYTTAVGRRLTDDPLVPLLLARTHAELDVLRAAADECCYSRHWPKTPAAACACIKAHADFTR
jgi:hypothetical protein